MMAQNLVYFSIISRFIRNNDGVAAIEFAFVAPVIVTLLFGTLTFFTAIYENQRNERATYTITDMISRFYDVDTDDLVSINKTFDAIIIHTASPMRVTSILRGDKKFTVQWSYVSGSYAKLNDADIPISRLPEISAGDSLIITETQSPLLPLTSFGGLQKGVIESFATARPRFVSAIVKTD